MKSIEDLIAVLGDDCVKITNLVIPYNFQEDSFIGNNILMHFPNLRCLSLQASEELLIDELNLAGFNWDTDFAVLGNFESVIQVDLTDAKQIKNERFTSLSAFPNLNQLDISGCTQITDFKFLESLHNLESLIAEGLQIPQEQLKKLEEKGVIVVTEMS